MGKKEGNADERKQAVNDGIVLHLSCGGRHTNLPMKNSTEYKHIHTRVQTEPRKSKLCGFKSILWLQY